MHWFKLNDVPIEGCRDEDWIPVPRAPGKSEYTMNYSPIDYIPNCDEVPDAQHEIEPEQEQEYQSYNITRMCYLPGISWKRYS